MNITDEALHLKLTQGILNRVIKEDQEWAEVAEECREEALEIYLDIANQEKGWAKYLFQEGSMLGLNEEILCNYVDWIASKRLSAIGYEYPLEAPASNPLPWMDQWLSSASKQTALQEAENDSYLIGVVGGTHTQAVEKMRNILDSFSEEKESPLYVYTKTVCPYCVKLKSFMDSKEISYTEINAELDKNREFLMNNRLRTVPQVFDAEGNYLGDCDNFINNYEG